MNTVLTDLLGRAVETDKTDEAGSVSNAVFLDAVFGAHLGDNLPMLVSFAGNPNDATPGCWQAQPWEPSGDTAAATNTQWNNYFTLASFVPDDAGARQRKKSNFFALHAIMLDDVGSKAEQDRLVLAPSWLLETSPGNFQAGYILAEPLQSHKEADRLMDAIIAAGLSDPGANGPCARLARLPVGVNGKHSPAFVCHLAAWRPDARYTVTEIINGLQLDMTALARPKRDKVQRSQAAPVEGDQVWFPRPQKNAVLEAIQTKGLYKVTLTDGRHDITCPWLHEHTSHQDGGTAYFEPSEDFPIGGFHCMHGHCTERNIHSLLDFLQLDIAAARMKATIRVVPGELERILDAAERELARLGGHYQRGGTIVSVTQDPGTGETRVVSQTPGALVRGLACVAYWERYDARAKSFCRIDPHTRHASLLLESARYTHLPVLSGLTRQPYLRQDGSLMLQPGYDAYSRMFGAFDAADFRVPELPTRAEAEEALALLQSTIAEFCFAHEVDRCAALAALITAAIRPSLPNAPMFHVRAHAPGTGKSYLCALITAFATPQANTPTALPSDDTECHKLLVSELLRSPAVIEFDNLTDDLPALKSLCTVLTSEYLSGRLLSTNKIATVDTRTLLLSSGNNVGPVQDMTRRCLTINLDAAEEVPAARKFQRPDLVAEIRRERGRYASAALTIVRAWLVANRPLSECRTLAGFADWSMLVCQPLRWLGCLDPTASAFTAMGDDPDRHLLQRLLTAWYAAFQTRAITVRDVLAVLSETYDGHADLREVLLELSGGDSEYNSRKVGRWLLKHAGRRVHSMRIVKAAGSGSVQKWQLRLAESVSQVSAVFEGLPINTVTESVSDHVMLH